ISKLEEVLAQTEAARAKDQEAAAQLLHFAESLQQWAGLLDAGELKPLLASSARAAGTSTESDESSSVGTASSWRMLAERIQRHEFKTIKEAFTPLSDADLRFIVSLKDQRKSSD